VRLQRLGGSERDVYDHVITLPRMSEAPLRTCYRHPNRETGLSCSECGRPICTECMTVAPVGLRCPEHSGKPQGAARVVQGARRLGYEGSGALATKALIGVNVAVYLICLAQGSSLGQTTGSLFDKGALLARGLEVGSRVVPIPLNTGPITGTFQGLPVHLVGIAAGDWWRLITAAFLHGSIIHIGFNMVMLWWVGSPVEAALGRARFLGLYFASGLAGSAGALIADPNAVTVGASGAIFGILGAALVFERQRHYVLGGSATGIIVINLVISFSVPNISYGGHIGGLVGGILCGLILSRLGRAHAAYSRLGITGFLGLAAVGAASVAVAYLKVRGQI
jgi:membrane associated rhomboid family serine protease